MTPTSARRIVFLAACIITLLVSGVPLRASAPPGPALFVDSRTESPAAAGPEVVRERVVVPRIDLLPEAIAVTLNLFDDVELIALRERIEMRGPGRFGWFGRLRGDPMTMVVLTVHDGSLAGNIYTRSGLFQVRDTGTDGAHVIRQIDPSAFPPEAPGIPVDDLELSGDTTGAAADTGAILDVLIAYTDDAAEATGDIESEIRLAIDETNQIYAQSQVNQRLRLVLSREIEYDETGDSQLDLDRLRDPDDGFLDDVHPWRDAYCADYVQLWLKTTSGCGRASIMVIVDPAFEEFAFSVVKRSCAVGNMTAAHELGHNMGAVHDRPSATSPGAYGYSYGYINVLDRWRTLMAINSFCNHLGFSCTRLPYVSNPDVLYEGDPMGVPEGEPDAADNRLTFNNTAPTTAAFRDSTACALEVPQQTLRVDKSGADVTVSWGETCGTAFDYTIYEGDLDVLRASGTFDHESVVCSDVAGDRTETFSPASGNAYFVAVPRGASGVEGEYGFGRPQGLDISGCGITGHRPGGCP